MVIFQLCVFLLSYLVLSFAHVILWCLVLSTPDFGVKRKFVSGT